MYKRTGEDIGSTLAMTMDVETFDAGGEVIRRRQVFGQDAEAGAWGAGIVQLGLYLAVLGIDAKAERGRLSSRGLSPRPP